MEMVPVIQVALSRLFKKMYANEGGMPDISASLSIEVRSRPESFTQTDHGEILFR